MRGPRADGLPSERTCQREPRKGQLRSGVRQPRVCGDPAQLETAGHLFPRVFEKEAGLFGNTCWECVLELSAVDCVLGFSTLPPGQQRSSPSRVCVLRDFWMGLPPWWFRL